MKNEETYKTLEKIRNKYSEIIHITETLQYNSYDDKTFKAINQRAKLLNEIELEHSILRDEYPQWQDYCKLDVRCRNIKDEIKLLISFVLSLDDTLKETLSDRINAEKSKIKVLKKRAKMALSYAKF